MDMKLEYRYYVAKRTQDAPLKIAHEVEGPYYNETVLIRDSGYETRAEAMAAVETYIKDYKTRYDYDTSYTFTILEELTMSEED
jgi:hypothetical protein